MRALQPDGAVLAGLEASWPTFAACAAALHAAGLRMTGLAYNKKMFAEKGWAAPTSWMDLADPKFKGKVADANIAAAAEAFEFVKNEMKELGHAQAD